MNAIAGFGKVSRRAVLKRAPCARALFFTAALQFALAPSAARAADFTFLTHPDLAGRITLDPWLGNADDLYVPALNTIGAATQFTWLCCGSSDVYGFLGGSMSTAGVTPFGLRDQQYFGLNQHVAQSLFGEWNSNSQFSFNNPFTQTMPPGAASSILINEDQTYTTSFILQDSAVGGRLAITGQGYYELSWQAAGVHGGEEEGHFAFVRNYLPEGWWGVAHELQSWEILDGPYAGVTGFTTTTFYTMDSDAIPQVSTPGVLGAPWVTSGYAAVSDYGDGPVLTVGSPDTPAQDGTASLSGGHVVSLSSLTLGPTGSGTVTVEGAGTRVDIAQGTTVQGFSEEAVQVIRVLDGAAINGGYTALYGAGHELEVDGPDSLFSARGYLQAFGGASNVVASNGARIDLVSDGTAALMYLDSSSHALVDGSGSQLLLRGAPEGASVNPLFSVVALELSSGLVISNGGRVTIEASSAGLSGLEAGALIPFAAEVAPSTVLIDGEDSVLDADRIVNIGALLQADADFTTYVDAHAAGSAATLTVRNGGTVIADDILIGQAGTLDGNGGTLIGDVENRGTVAPGESPGTLTILGNYLQTADGRLVIEIAGSAPGEYDVLDVSGSVTAGGTLEIRLLGDYVPDAGASFDFLLAGAFTGTFDAYLLPILGNGQSFQLSFGEHGLVAVVAPVPLPGALPLLGFALGGLALVRRKRNDIVGWADEGSPTFGA